MTEIVQKFGCPSMGDKVSSGERSVRVDLAAPYRLTVGVHVTEALHLVYHLENFFEAQLRQQKCTSFWLTWRLLRKNRFQR